MATHSSTLAWTIPGTGEPGGLPSMGSQSRTRLKRFSSSSSSICELLSVEMGFRGGSDSKESACSAEDLGLIPGLERSPGGGYGNPFQYFCLENLLDRGAWWATVYAVIKGWTQMSN